VIWAKLRRKKQRDHGPWRGAVPNASRSPKECNHSRNQSRRDQEQCYELVGLVKVICWCPIYRVLATRKTCLRAATKTPSEARGRAGSEPGPGGGFAVRQLYSDQDEVLFDAARPVIQNGIEDIVTRP
jgi:hypothetical protein